MKAWPKARATPPTNPPALKLPAPQHLCAADSPAHGHQPSFSLHVTSLWSMRRPRPKGRTLGCCNGGAGAISCGCGYSQASRGSETKVTSPWEGEGEAPAHLRDTSKHDSTEATSRANVTLNDKIKSGTRPWISLCFGHPCPDASEGGCRSASARRGRGCPMPGTSASSQLPPMSPSQGNHPGGHIRERVFGKEQSTSTQEQVDLAWKICSP